MSAFEDILDDPVPATTESTYDEDPFGDPTPTAVADTTEEHPISEPISEPLSEPLSDPFSEPLSDPVPETQPVFVPESEPETVPEPVAVSVTPPAVSAPTPVATTSHEAREDDAQGTFLEIKLKPEGSEFEINVKDPEKKGEGMNTYIVYNVETKTTSKDFSSSNMSVTRRFTNFVWLFNQLTTKYPGVIVPPIAEKQALGRFESEFVDLRRAQLEKCLRKISCHPELSKSHEFKMFLESKDLEGDIKKNEPKKGFFSSITSSVTEAVSTATSTFAKIPEPDEWFDTKKSQIEVFDSQLKVLDKVLDVFVKQRKDLANSLGDFGDSVSSLGTSEFNKSLSSCLNHLGEVEKKIKDLHIAQSENDSSNLRFIVDEYIRTVDSIKIALNARVKQYQAWKTADANLIKKKEQLAKLTQQGKSSKAVTLEAEVSEDEKNLEKSKASFDSITELVKKELQRFDLEKIQDFRTSLLKFVESTMETQKKIISLWEGYLPEVQSI